MKEPARYLAIIQEHDVLALEDVERLGGVVVDVERRPKSRRLLRFEEREDSVRLVRVRFDRHSKGAGPRSIDLPSPGPSTYASPAAAIAIASESGVRATLPQR